MLTFLSVDALNQYLISIALDINCVEFLFKKEQRLLAMKLKWTAIITSEIV